MIVDGQHDGTMSPSGLDHTEAISACEYGRGGGVGRKNEWVSPVKIEHREEDDEEKDKEKL